MQSLMVMFFFLFWTFICKFYSRNLLTFWCYLINLPAVYSQRHEANGFSCLSCKAVLHTETWSQWLFLFYHVKLFYTLLFIFFYFKPLVTPLFIHLFSVLFFFWSKRLSHFHTLNIYRQVLREFLQFRNVQWVVIISHKCLIIT